MEPQKHQQQQPNSDDNVNNNNVNGAKGGSFLCRQTSTRWTPTTDQIRILKDLYYNKGVRSPSADEIQRISAKLRHYGKIEGKNVFYWFQNHKARERQKKRFTNDHAYVPPMQQSRTTTTAHHVPSNNPTNNWKPDQDYISFHHTNYSNNITTPGFFPASSSSTGVLTVGQMGNTYGYGSVTIEKGYMDCSGNNGVGGGGNINHNNGSWLGMDPYNPHYSSLFDNRKSINECPEDEQDQEEEETEIETLPLFPTHREDINGNFCNIKHNPNFYYSSRWYGASDAHGNAASRASLELSLNSYTGHQYSRD